NPQPSTLNPQPSTLNPQPSTLNPQPSTQHPAPQTPNPKPHTPDTAHGATGRPPPQKGVTKYLPRARFGDLQFKGGGLLRGQ
ncbi:hypothetical protein T484DRAFT_1620975, partial [Baffinella frigidus]